MTCTGTTHQNCQECALLDRAPKKRRVLGRTMMKPPDGAAEGRCQHYRPRCDNCHTCLSAGGSLAYLSRMILCPICGNKRCPHATDHRNACTNSNAKGQPGSIY